ncbi:hypothetical protein Bhyg_15731, partial [Pseudolycoriella hygida]
FEGKHKEIKAYAKNTNSRVNLSHSLAKKLQYNFALRLLQKECLKDRITIHQKNIGSIQNKPYFSRISQSPQLDALMAAEHSFAKKVIINGIIFSPELWLPVTRNDALHINEIIDIVMIDENDISKIFVIVKQYENVSHNEHFQCYMIGEAIQHEIMILNVEDFLEQHQYPVKIHIDADRSPSMQICFDRSIDQHRCRSAPIDRSTSMQIDQHRCRLINIDAD